jgi:Zn-dependent oligopeptidase
LRFERVSAENCQIWHKDVECYEVFDVRDPFSLHKSLGHFYLDLYERADKNMHAACRPLTKSSKISDNESENSKPSAVLICNFAKPEFLGAK